MAITANDTNDLATFIDKVFGSDGFELFCGAGISFDSGLPLAAQLQNEILSEVLIRQIPKHCPWTSHPLNDDYAKSKMRINDILEAQVPFEVIMEGALLSGHSDILKVFDCKFPNINHFSIANLVRRKVLKTIYTTNFDTLIEQAIRQDKEKVKDQQYLVLHTPENIRSWSTTESDNNITGIIKLHGCSSDIPSLKTTITKVAERKLVDSLKPALEKFLKTNNHKVVIFTGYSFSDSFDINPAINSIVNPDKQIIWIEHVNNGCKIEHLSQIVVPDYLTKYKGWKVKCNTSTFLKKLTNHYGVSPIEPKKIHSFDWKEYIKKWGNETSRYNNWNNYMMMGYIFNRMGNHQDAIPFYERAAWISSQANDTDMESHICSLISGSYQYIKKQKMQDDYSRRASLLSQKGRKSEFFSLLAKGTACYEKNDFAKAKSIFESMLIRPEFSEDDLKARVFIGLAIANHGLGRYGESISFSKESLKLSQACGNIVNQISSHMNLGLAYADTNNYQESLNEDQLALALAKSLKNKQLINNIEDNIKRNKNRERLFNLKTRVKGIFKRK